MCTFDVNQNLSQFHAPNSDFYSEIHELTPQIILCWLLIVWALYYIDKSVSRSQLLSDCPLFFWQDKNFCFHKSIFLIVLVRRRLASLWHVTVFCREEMRGDVFWKVKVSSLSLFTLLIFPFLSVLNTALRGKVCMQILNKLLAFSPTSPFLWTILNNCNVGVGRLP